MIDGKKSSVRYQCRIGEGAGNKIRRLGQLIQVDIGGHPPIPLGAPPLSISVFQFRQSLLFLAVFRVLNFRSRFEALNDVFWENGEKHGSMDRRCSFQICSP